MIADELVVCVLLYGNDDYCFRMAQRVINSPLRRLGENGVEFRFGMNAVGSATREFVREAVKASFADALVIDSHENIHKYPMMRRLFYDKPLASDYLMWFDDDSCINTDTDVATWWPRIRQQLGAYKMLGSIHKDRFAGNQRDWIRDQTWYGGKELAAFAQFAAGGWWVIHSDVLRQFNWPPQSLKHRGGDVMLGELLRQHDLPLGHFRDGVWINANEHGVESQSTRRGVAETPVGFDYRGVACASDSLV